MEDYIIWLKSGECITGTAKEDVIKILQDTFINFTEKNEKFSFADEDGRVVLKLSRIEAIGITKRNEEKHAKQAGFMS